MRRLQDEWLEKYQGVPFSAADLKTDLDDYSAARMKLSRLVAQGVLLRLKKGFYCLAPDYSSKLIEHGVIANALYGPSYISFDSALSLYGLIPERTYETMSAVIKRGAFYRTPVGRFGYYQIPQDVFGMGVRSEKTANGTYLMANPTKAMGPHQAVVTAERRPVMSSSIQRVRVTLIPKFRAAVSPNIQPLSDLISSALPTNPMQMSGTKSHKPCNPTPLKLPMPQISRLCTPFALA